jgi:hypothetical protein
MGAIVPQVITEDRAGGAQIVDGGLRFDGSKSQYLSRTFGSGSQTTWTWAGWVKRNKTAAVADVLFSANYSSGLDARISFSSTDTIYYSDGGGPAGTLETTAVYRDFSSWMHIVFVYDSSNGTSTDRLRLYVNGSRVTAFGTATYPNSSVSSSFNGNKSHTIGQFASVFGYYINTYLSTVYFIDGAALDPSYFGYTDPLTNVWRPKKLDITKTPGASYGTNGFYLPFDGSAPIGQDQSGRGNNWTPVNFGGSNTIEKATGALPILNTDGGGKVARVGVRTDTYASSLSLAIPFIGRSSDLSNQINSGSSTKTTTDSGVTYPTTTTNFYGSSAVYFDSTDTITLSGTWFSDTNFTVEFWAYITDYGDLWTVGGNSCSFYVQSNYISLDGNGVGRVNFTIASGIKIPLNKWTHFAYVKDSSNYYMFIDGVKWTAPIIAAGQNSGTWVLGGTRSDVSDSADWYLQDLRYYSIAKYTSDFIPASTDPDIVPDSPSGVSYSSNVALVPSTDGAVAFNATNDRLSLASSSDFDLTSVDWTIETFFNCTSTSSTRMWYFGNNAQNIQWSGTNQLGYYNGTTLYTFGSLSLNTWYHLALVNQSGTVTAYINGISQTTFPAGSSTTRTLTIGNFDSGTNPWIGFISNFHVVKGTALYTSNFTPPSAPISSVANTKLLCCKSNSSATAADVTPGTITANGNAAASNFNPFTVNINTQRGKQSGYCTWNPLSGNTYSASYQSGNLVFNTVGIADDGLHVFGTFQLPSSGKWYWETNWETSTGFPGINSNSNKGNNTQLSTMKVYNPNGDIGGSGSGTNSTWTTGDTIGMIYDADAGTLKFHKNGIIQNSTISNVGSSSGPWWPQVRQDRNSKSNTNFGQKPFKFPPPAGFQPLALANTPRPSIVRPDQYVGVTTYSGDNGSTRQVNVGFKPDFIWLKCRNVGRSHRIIDTVRGVSNQLFSDSTSGGNAYDATTYPSSVTSVNNSGFVLTNSGTDQYNTSGENYVAWCWKAGGNSNTYNINDVGYATASAAGLTTGTITPTGASEY